MTKIELLERVQRIGGFGRDADAEGAIEATLEALGAALVPSERRAVSEHLPLSWRPILEAPAHLPDLDSAAFFERVQRHDVVAAGRAREHAQIVCRALVDTLPDEVITLLQRRVPQLAFLFEKPETTVSRSHRSELSVVGTRTTNLPTRSRADVRAVGTESTRNRKARSERTT